MLSPVLRQLTVLWLYGRRWPSSRITPQHCMHNFNNWLTVYIKHRMKVVWNWVLIAFDNPRHELSARKTMVLTEDGISLKDNYNTSTSSNQKKKEVWTMSLRLPWCFAAQGCTHFHLQASVFKVCFLIFLSPLFFV